MMWRHDERAGEQQASAFMRSLAAKPLNGQPLPDAAFLWWKAQLLRRWDAGQQAVAPLEAGERIEAGVGILAGVLLLGWMWQSLSPATWTPAVGASIVAAAILLTVAAAVALWSLRTRT